MTSFFDDFDDGTIDSAWTTSGGGWSESGSQLQTDANNLVAVTRSQANAYGTWQLKIDNVQFNDDFDYTDSVVYVCLPNGASDLSNGYAIEYATNDDGVRLLKLVDGAATTLINAPLLDEPYDIELSRDSAGTFSLTVNGTSYGTATDTTFTSSQELHLVGIGGLSDSPFAVDYIGVEPLPPAAPASASQTITGDGSITVSWDGVTTASNYRLEVGEDGGSYQTVATSISADTSSYAYQASPGTDTHQFRVRAENTAGSSDWVDTATKSTDIGSVSLTVVDNDQIDLSWDAVDDADEYDILRADASGSTRSDYTVAGTVGTNTTTYSDTTVEDGEQYYYRIDAVYSGTNSLSADEVAGTTPLPAPTLDALDASVADAITVEYILADDSSDGDVTVERSRDGGSSWTTVATIAALSQTSYTDTGLLDGEAYHYRLTRATDHVSAQSGTLSATTILPAPTELSVGTVDATSAAISWTDNHDYGDTRVDYRRSSSSSWTEWATVDRGVENDTLTGLLNGEAYDVRVVAVTEHTATEDQ